MPGRMAAALAVVGTLCCALAAAAAAQQAGEVLAVNGQCFVELSARRVALRPGDAVHVGDGVACPAGAKVKLRMSDGSVIAVAPGTQFTIAAYDAGAGAGAGGRTVKLTLAAGL